MQKDVKCRKEHFCEMCERKIAVGETATVLKQRFPVYRDNEWKQIGIQYYTHYFCTKPDCCEVADKIDERESQMV